MLLSCCPLSVSQLLDGDTIQAPSDVVRCYFLPFVASRIICIHLLKGAETLIAASKPSTNFAAALPSITLNRNSIGRTAGQFSCNALLYYIKIKRKINILNCNISFMCQRSIQHKFAALQRTYQARLNPNFIKFSSISQRILLLMQCVFTHPLPI